jgi:hypothetical protein
VKFEWVDGFKIEVNCVNNELQIKANSEGLISLANHLRALAESTTLGAHMQLDEFNSLEPGSVELIIEKLGK